MIKTETIDDEDIDPKELEDVLMIDDDSADRVDVKKETVIKVEEVNNNVEEQLQSTMPETLIGSLP